MCKFLSYPAVIPDRDRGQIHPDLWLQCVQWFYRFARPHGHLENCRSLLLVVVWTMLNTLGRSLGIYVLDTWPGICQQYLACVQKRFIFELADGRALAKSKTFGVTVCLHKHAKHFQSGTVEVGFVLKTQRL